MKAELLKGHLDALVLAALEAEPAHGYAIIQRLRQRSDEVFRLPGGNRLPDAAPARARRARQEPLDGGERPPPPRSTSSSRRAQGARGTAARVAAPSRRLSRRCWRGTYLDRLDRPSSRPGSTASCATGSSPRPPTTWPRGEAAGFGEPAELRASSPTSWPPTAPAAPPSPASARGPGRSGVSPQPSS